MLSVTSITCCRHCMSGDNSSIQTSTQIEEQHSGHVKVVAEPGSVGVQQDCSTDDSGECIEAMKFLPDRREGRAEGVLDRGEGPAQRLLDRGEGLAERGLPDRGEGQAERGSLDREEDRAVQFGRGEDHTERVIMMTGEDSDGFSGSAMPTSSRRRRMHSACEKGGDVDFAEALTCARFEEINGQIEVRPKARSPGVSPSRGTANNDLFKNTLGPAKQALEHSGSKKNQVDENVLVGSSIRTSKVQKLIKDFSNGKKRNRDISSDDAVIYGAVVQADILIGKGSPDLSLFEGERTMIKDNHLLSELQSCQNDSIFLEA